MIINMPLCKCFIANEKFYLYDAVKNCILELTAVTYKAINDYLVGLKKGTNDDCKYSESAEIKELKKRGFLQASPILTIQNNMSKSAIQILNRKLNFIILCVTHNCNLRCRYCNYSSPNELDRIHEDIKMSYEVGKRAIDFFLEHSCDSQDLDIGFYGGEPLLNWTLIESIINYVNSLNINKSIKYSLTTNLTYLPSNIMESMVRHNIDILISLDGPKEINDLQRFQTSGDGSFDIVMSNIRRLKNYNLNYYLNHVGINSVLLRPQFEEKVSTFFQRNFAEVSDRITITPADLSKIEFLNDLLASVDNGKTNNEHSIFNTEKRSATQVAETLENGSAIHDKEYPKGQCIPGYERLFVDCNGELFPCEKISTHNRDANIGNIYTGFNAERIYNLMNICSKMEECKSCWAFRFCGACCAQFDSGLCFDLGRNRVYCENRKKKVLSIMKEYCMHRN